MLTVESKLGAERLLGNLGRGKAGWKVVTAVVDSGAEETVARWVERNVCNSPMTEPANLDLESTIPGAETTRKTWEDCAKGTRAELWTIEKGGHVPRISGTFIPEILNWITEHPRANSNP